MGAALTLLGGMLLIWVVGTGRASAVLTAIVKGKQDATWSVKSPADKVPVGRGTGSAR